MLLRFLGINSTSGQSPTLYASDRESYVIQGWRTDEIDTIEIPHPLLAYLEPGTCLGALLRDTGHGTFMLSGKPVTDLEALALMDTPDHEASVEVPIAKEIRRDAAPGR